MSFLLLLVVVLLLLTQFLSCIIFQVDVDERKGQGSRTKVLSVPIENCGISTITTALLSNIWHQAAVILSDYHVLEVGDGYVVTEYSSCTKINMVGTNGNLKCGCNTFKSTSGICAHVLVVAEEKKELSLFLARFSKPKKQMPLNNIPKRAGEKPKEKKKRKGKNNVKSVSIVTEQPPVDPYIDLPKPTNFTEIYHNNNPFFVVFTTALKQPVKCQSCKVEFQSKGQAVCVPYDIALGHNERYYYPKKDDQGRLIGMEPTWKKEARRYYCIK